MKPPPEVRAWMSEMGRKGRGAAKARTPEQARAAVNERWRRWRERQNPAGQIKGKEAK